MVKFIKVLGFWALALGLIVMSANQAFSQDEEIAVAEAVGEPVAEATADEATPSSRLRPLTVSATLNDEFVITGTLIDSTSIAIKTAFGEASIPLSEVAGIRFPGGDDTSTTIVMMNGDSITGATDLQYANVETTWGSAKINGPNVRHLLFVPGLVWQAKDGLSGKRWGLVEKAKASNPVRQAGATQPARPNQNQVPVQPQPFRTNRGQIFYGN